MFEYLDKEKYLKKLAKMSGEELLEEYINIRTRGSLLCSLGNVKNADVNHWEICEDYIVNKRKVGFDTLNEFAISYILLKSTKKNPNLEGLMERQNKSKEKILEILN